MIGKCRECKWWKGEKAPRGEAGFRYCRYNPPIIIGQLLIDALKTNAGMVEAVGLASKWPVTYWDEGCHHYEESMEKL